jgi:hypothetical protein
MKVNGKMIRHMALVFLLILMELDMKVNGLMICNMGKGQRLGIMVLPDIQDNFSKVKNMAKVNLNGKTVATMKEILLMDNFKALENIILLIWIKFIKENSE